MTTQEAMKHLAEVLKSDEAYRYAWQANIAVQFQDEWQRAAKAGGLPSSPNQIHNISNAAADNFLNLLCMDVEATNDPVSADDTTTLNKPL